MSKVKSQTAGVSISFGALLTLLFIAAKLWGRVDWPWWQVFAPLWMPPAAILGVCAVIAVLAGLVWCIGSIGEALGRALKGRRDNNL
jgi:hypothetical protein